MCEAVCENCAHWDKERAVWVAMPILSPYTGEEYLAERKLCPCAISAVEADAGDGSLVLLAHDSHCRHHADAFAPSLEALEWEEAQADLAAWLGVERGEDRPLGFADQAEYKYFQ